VKFSDILSQMEPRIVVTMNVCQSFLSAPFSPHGLSDAMVHERVAQVAAIGSVFTQKADQRYRRCGSSAHGLEYIDLILRLSVMQRVPPIFPSLPRVVRSRNVHCVTRAHMPARENNS
jgi:hypothetical protein